MENAKTDCKKTEQALLTFCRQRRLFEPYHRVIAACSGGADSMALVLFLQKYASELGVRLEVCHVNHGLRQAAARDEAFVREFCQKNGLLLHLLPPERRTPPPPAAGEDWARRLRYSFFESLAAGDETVCIATAHTLNDQAETLLFRMARGAGVHGLGGIPAKRGVFVRPMLCVTRAETESLCAAAGQEYVTDETNFSDAYARNRIRHHALPALEAANPQAVRAMGALAAKMGELDAYFAAKAATLLQKAACPPPREFAPGWHAAIGAGESADTALSAGESADTNSAQSNAESAWCAAPGGGESVQAWRLAELAAADAPVLQWALHALVSAYRDAEEKYIVLLRELVQSGTGAVQLTGRVRFFCRGGLLICDTAEQTPPQNPKAAPNPACIDPNPKGCPGGAPPAEQPFAPGEYRLPNGQILHAEIENYEHFEKNRQVHKKDLNCVADYAKIQNNTILRTRRAGDSFFLPGRGVTKSLKKLYNELGIPLWQRPLLPLLAQGSRVVWLLGQGFAADMAPTAETKIVLRIIIEQKGE